jgi:hypothetical protein
MAIIFLIIILPLTMLLSSYVQVQVDTALLIKQYDTKLKSATYDAIKAYQTNTLREDMSVTLADAKKGNIEAAISTFISTLTISMGVGGYNEDYMRQFVPAILFSMYDGYYIYAPTRVPVLNEYGNETDEYVYQYILRPYNYYSVRFTDAAKSIDVVINYSLDNYVVVYGWVGSDYVTKSGYLVSNNVDVQTSESLYKYLPAYRAQSAGNNELLFYTDPAGQELMKYRVTDPAFGPDTKATAGSTVLYPRNEVQYVDPNSATLYYEEANQFTSWFRGALGSVTADKARRVDQEGGYEYLFPGDTTQIFNFTNNNPEDLTSTFTQYKMEIIRRSIEDSLNQAISAYSDNSSSYDYRLPKLLEEDWFLLLSNVCMLTFMQGLPVGTTYYNNYAIVRSSANQDFAGPESLYFVNQSADGALTGDGYYHTIDCTHLQNSNIVGYSNVDYIQKSFSTGSGEPRNYYLKRPEKACYYCIVQHKDYKKDIVVNDKNYDGEIDLTEFLDAGGNEARAKAYYTTLAREKYKQYKPTVFGMDGDE